MSKKSRVIKRKCCVPGCHFFGELSGGKFPVNEFQRSAWLSAFQMAHARPGDRVCLNHFKEDDFIQYDKSKRLKKHVVPSLFLSPAPIIEIGLKNDLELGLNTTARSSNAPSAVTGAEASLVPYVDDDETDLPSLFEQTFDHTYEPTKVLILSQVSICYYFL